MGVVVRLLSTVVRPGHHDLASPTAFFWMALSGLHTVAFRAFLPIVPATFFTRTYFRLAGCRIGRNVWLTTCVILDPYLISIGDDTFIGGDTVISAHQFENGRLTIGPIRIGARCDIGADLLINLGVTIGDGARIGQRVYLREGRRVPEGARVAAVGGLPVERVFALERGRIPRG